MPQKTVIIGGVAGGASAAARLRRLDEHAKIVMFERGEFISYANCGLPYYISGVISDKEELLVQTPEGMRERFNIDVRIKSEVTAIDRKGKTVRVRCSDGREYDESYDKLVLAPGAAPVKPEIAGMDEIEVFTLRNVPDTYRIKDFVDLKKPGRAMVIGAGFIGLELAENLHMSGVEVKVVELADHVMGPLDFEMAAIVHQSFREKGLGLYLRDSVKAFSRSDAGITARLDSGRTVETDMVIMGIGVKPEIGLAKKAGLSIGDTGGHPCKRLDADI